MGKVTGRTREDSTQQATVNQRRLNRPQSLNTKANKWDRELKQVDHIKVKTRHREQTQTSSE